jgi:hypothetical protein
LKGEFIIKFFSIILISIGLVSSIFGLLPVLFIYPYKYWDATSQYWNFIFFQDENRSFWQLGLIALLAGIFLYIKAKKNEASLD